MLFAASAPAKVILLGEHAVVYGFPAIAVPVSNLRAVARFKPTGGPLSVTAADLQTRVVYGADNNDENVQALAAIMWRTAEYLDLEHPLGEVIVESAIPISSGLGSSAAVSAATARGIAALYHREIPDEALNELVYAAERIQHGTPSGIDNTVVVYEKPVYFVKDSLIEPLDVQGTFNFIIADSGFASSTREAVLHVRQLYRQCTTATREIFAGIGKAVNEAKSCLQTRDQKRLGTLMTENHRQLQRLRVSSLELDRLVEAAIGAGALGAKLSGGGMGGNMIALAEAADIDAVKNRLLQAGAAQIRDFTLRQERDKP